jgi:hypothetical protein
MAEKGASIGERIAAVAAALDVAAIGDERLRAGLVLLLNLVEELAAENARLRQENQQLRDENARLKGGSGKPDIKPNLPRRPAMDYSSEAERAERKGWQKRAKVGDLPVDRVERLALDRAGLPADAEFKGHERVVVQDVVFRRENVAFEREKYYSAAEGKAYTAALPAGYRGGFGPGLRSLVLVLYYLAQVSEPKVLALLRGVGVAISKGELSNLLIRPKEPFEAERAAVVAAGLGSSPWQQTDHTPQRVDGVNRHCQVLSSPVYTAYATTATKDRQAVLSVLRAGRPAEYLWNEEAAAHLERAGLSAKLRRRLAELPSGTALGQAELDAYLAERVGALGPQQRRWLLDGLGLAAYRAQADYPAVDTLVCDDAPQWVGVARARALCWVHEGRLYKQLGPYLPGHRRLLDEFLGEFWAYYRELAAYRAAPSPAAATGLAAAFDTLFATETGYWALDNRIALTREKKAGLLAVLDHPELPLHNNAAELAARQRVRKRDVSFGPRNEDGKRAWDTFQTLVETAHKLGLSAYDYFRDRVYQTDLIPPLADLIHRKAAQLNLSASWATT